MASGGEKKIMIPKGYTFKPSDEQLISCFLLPKAMGEELTWNYVIADKVAYGDNATPWEVFRESEGYWTTTPHGGGIKKSTYIFTNLTKTSPNSKRNSRKAGCGTWGAESCPTRITDSTQGCLIGCRRMLKFKVPKAAAAMHSGGDWIMHQYSLAGASLMKVQEAGRDKDVVLCRIIKFIKAAAVPVEQHPIQMISNKRAAEDSEGSRNGCKKHKSGAIESYELRVEELMESMVMTYVESNGVAAHTLGIEDGTMEGIS